MDTEGQNQRGALAGCIQADAFCRDCGRPALPALVWLRVTLKIMLKNMTITVSEELARWARKKAAEENSSVSRLAGQMLENEMRMGDEYQRAYRRWKRIQSVPLNAARRLSREDAHARR